MLLKDPQPSRDARPCPAAPALMSSADIFRIMAQRAHPPGPDALLSVVPPYEALRNQRSQGTDRSRAPAPSRARLPTDPARPSALSAGGRRVTQAPCPVTRLPESLPPEFKQECTRQSNTPINAARAQLQRHPARARHRSRAFSISGRTVANPRFAVPAKIRQDQPVTSRQSLRHLHPEFVIHGKRMQQEHRRAVAHNPIENVGIAAANAGGRQTFHAVIKTQRRLEHSADRAARRPAQEPRLG
jgi:hypothetical protein